MSTATSSDSATMPPPPTPCTHLPTRRTTISSALQHNRVPMVKNAKLDINTQVRPKISLSAARNGIVTALVRRYEVPIQKACVEVIDKAVVILNSVVITIVASRDIMSDIMARHSRIANSWKEGLQFCARTCC